LTKQLGTQVESAAVALEASCPAQPSRSKLSGVWDARCHDVANGFWMFLDSGPIESNPTWVLWKSEQVKSSKADFADFADFGQ